MTELPTPLTPPDCDLRGLPFMPLQVVTLMDSDLFIRSTGDEFKAAVALWCKSWNQIPGGSLPDDDVVLADLSRAKSWKKVKTMALRGWFLCSDGRLYHETVAENAIAAWEGRTTFNEKNENKESRQNRWRARVKALTEQLRELGVTPPKGAGLEKLEALLDTALNNKTVDTDVDGGASTSSQHVDDGEISYKGQCKGQGQGQGQLNIKPLTSSDTSSSEAPPQAGDRDDSGPQKKSRNIEISILLRSLGVKPMTAMHPLAVEWATNPKITDAFLTDVIDQARQYKTTGDISPNYIINIIAEKLNPPPPREDNTWRRTREGIDAKARELGLTAHERTYDEFAERIAKTIKERKAQQQNSVQGATA